MMLLSTIFSDTLSPFTFTIILPTFSFSFSLPILLSLLPFRPALPSWITRCLLQLALQRVLPTFRDLSLFSQTDLLQSEKINLKAYHEPLGTVNFCLALQPGS